MARSKVDYLRTDVDILKTKYGVAQVIGFHRNDARGRAACRVLASDDGAYVIGDDVEVIFEFCADAIEKAVERAVKYVEARGYVKDVLVRDSEQGAMGNNKD